MTHEPSAIAAPPPAPGQGDASGAYALYLQLAREFGPALARIARSHEADAELRRELLQDLHVALWQSLAGYDRRCSLRTWLYRVAHNTAATHVSRRRRSGSGVQCTLDELDAQPGLIDADSPAARADYDQAATRLHALIARLAPLDRQVIQLYLEDLDAAEIAEVTGLSAGNVATKIHRIKRLLARLYHLEDSP